MARLIFLAPPTPALDRLFTIDHAVGKHGPNYYKDVLLVQFFLRAVIATPPGAPPVPLNGNCDRQTITWIRYFQTAYSSGVREAARRGSGQIGTQFGDGSVRTVGGGSGSTPAVSDGTSNTVIVGEAPGGSGIQDGSSNTIVVGEQPPANADPHAHRHYGTVRPPHGGQPFTADMTIVRLNRAYSDAFGPARFRRLDLDPAFPRELFAAFYGVLAGF